MGGGERTQGSPLPFQSKGVPDRLVEVRDGLGGGEVEVGGRGQNALRSPLWPPQGPALSPLLRGPSRCSDYRTSSVEEIIAPPK